MKKRTAVIFAALLFLGLVTFVISQTVTGLTIVHTNGCWETDGGTNYYQAGMAGGYFWQGNITYNGTFTDVCINQNTLAEGICGASISQNFSHLAGVAYVSCANGCFNGACIAGNNTGGNSTNQTITCYNNAQCNPTTTRYCQNNSACISTTYYNCNNPGTIYSACVPSGGSGGCTICPNGCFNGACLPGNGTNNSTNSTTHLECVNQMCVSVSGAGANLCATHAQCQGNTTCYDSDGGNNLAVRGITLGWNSGVYYNHTDYCVMGTGYGNKTIAEGYCSSNSVQILQQNCPGNQTCSGGRCI